MAGWSSPWAFVTTAVGVNARAAFSLLFPPIPIEFGWSRGMTAGAFSFGFVVSAALSPALGRLMDRRGRPCTGPGSAPDAECALGATLPRSVQ
jgi:MFS family permease